MSSLEHFNNKKYVCSFCGFRTHKKYNLDVHKKNKHRAPTTVSIPTLYGNGVQAAATHQHTSNPHVHPYQSVHGHKAGVQQQGGRVQVLNQQQYHGKFDQVNTQPEYKYIKLLDLDLLKTRSNIEYLLQNVDHFLGCFPLDGLPPFPTSFPKSMIINTQSSGHPGEHWVALVLTETNCYYFDSFGLPTAPLNIHMYLQPHYKQIIYLDYRIQDSSSNYCGAYCVSFVLHVQDNLSYDQFIGHYHSDNLLENDEILKQDFSNISFLVKV